MRQTFTIHLMVEEPDPKFPEISNSSFNLEELDTILSQAGFKVDFIQHPVPGQIPVFYLKRKKVKTT